MPIYARRSSGGTKFKPAPAGTYAAVCVDVWEPWTEVSKFEESKGRLQDKTRICFLISEINPETNKEYEVSQIGTLSTHPKSRLGGLIGSWRGKPFEPGENFDWEALIGKGCLLSVVQNTSKDGRVFGNVGAIMPLPKGMVAPTVPAWYVRRKDKDRVPTKTGPGYETPADEEFSADMSDVPF